MKIYLKILRFQTDNNQFDQHAKSSIKEKRGLRDNLADLEDSLRRLKD